MSNAITIKEGDKGRNVSPVDRLVVNQTGGGETYWFPAEDTQGGSITVTKNGFYYAVNNDLDFFNEVVVNVPAEMSDEDKAKGKEIVGKDPDDNGNEYAVGTEEVDDGQGGTKITLTKTAIPSAIHIVIEPRKKDYYSGEALDFTGIHVYLMNANNQRFTNEDYPTGEIPFSELIFPVTIAEGDAEGNTYYCSDDGKINAFKFNCITQTGTVFADKTIELSENLYFANQVSCTIYATRYNGGVYFASESGHANSVLVLDDGSRILYGDTIGRNEIGSGSFIYPISSDKFSVVPESITYPYEFPVSGLSEKTKSSQYIPVQWIRSDGETLEDDYTITIIASANSTENTGTGDSGNTNQQPGGSGSEHTGGDF